MQLGTVPWPERVNLSPGRRFVDLDKQISDAKKSVLKALDAVISIRHDLLRDDFKRMMNGKIKPQELIRRSVSLLVAYETRLEYRAFGSTVILRATKDFLANR
jgi:hypothetical protein